MNAIKISGTITEVGPVQQITDKFSKAEVILETAEQYPQVLCIEFPNQSADALANFGPGDTVEISINVRGRKWTSPSGEDKYFTTLSAWRIEPLASSPGQTPPPPQNEEEDDDLPF
jgi:hypothetical protein